MAMKSGGFHLAMKSGGFHDISQMSQGPMVLFFFGHHSTWRAAARQELS